MAETVPGVGQVDHDKVQDEFQEVLDRIISQGPDLDPFRIEFETLARNLKSSHESEARLVTTTTDLMANISQLQENIFRSKKEEEEMSMKKKRLKEEISDAWNKVTQSQNKADECREETAEFKKRCAELEEKLKVGSGWTPEQTAQMAELKKERDDLSREAEARTQSLQEVRDQVSGLAEDMRVAEEKRAKVEADIASFKEQISAKQAETNKELRRKRRLDEELKGAKERVETLSQEVKDKEDEAKRVQREIQQLREQHEATRRKCDSVLRQQNELFQRNTSTAAQLQEKMQANRRLAEENEQRERDLDRKRKEVEEVGREVERVGKLRDHTKKRIEQARREHAELEETRDQLKTKVRELEAMIEAERREGDVLRKKVENHAREREILNKNMVKADEASRQTFDLIKIHENTRKNLENEIAGYRQHGQEQRDVITTLDQERERYAQEVEATRERYFTALEEVKLQDLQIGELQSRILQGEKKLKQQQNLYEAVRADRNLYSKSLIESQEEISEMKRKFKIMNHQIDQLKEEVTGKDRALVQEHFEHTRVERDKEALHKELAKIRKQIQSSEQIISNQESEVQKLTQIIAEAEEEKTRQQKEYEAVVNERDILGSQLIRRNEELSQLYEKIKIQKSMLAKGEVQYEQRVAEVTALKRRIAVLKGELETSKSQVANIDELRNEVFRLERELLAEKHKIKALTEELERPMNVHRWRKLAGSDPKRYELVRKIHNLQKELIAKTEEVAEKDSLIEEKERLYVELKNVLARQPGPEVAEQLAVYQQNLKEKNQQLRAMNQELDMYKTQADEYKYDIKRLNEQLEDLKKQYFRQARRGQRIGHSMEYKGEDAFGAGDQAPWASKGGAHPPLAGADFKGGVTDAAEQRVEVWEGKDDGGYADDERKQGK